MELKTCNILGLDILVTDMEKTVNLIEQNIEQLRGTLEDIEDKEEFAKHVEDVIEQNIEQLRGKYICVGNVHTTVMAHDDPQYHTVQADAAFVLPDGGPLSGYSRKHGFPEAERVTGPDLMLALFARDNGLKHYFYGSSEETLALLKEKLAEKYPHLQIAGMVSPPFRELSEAEDKEMVDQINASGADIIWVGLGAPKQEKWMYAHKNHVNGVMIGVGAGFDYHAGNIKRAPGWMQKLSLEWLYRLLQDPKRLFKRYLVTNTRYLWLKRGLVCVEFTV